MEQWLQNPYVTGTIGAALMWALLTLIPQTWTDWLTRQDRFAVALVLAAIVVFVFVVLPSLTWKMLVGVVVAVILLAVGAVWYFHFRGKNKK